MHTVDRRNKIDKATRWVNKISQSCVYQKYASSLVLIHSIGAFYRPSLTCLYEPSTDDLSNYSNANLTPRKPYEQCWDTIWILSMTSPSRTFKYGELRNFFIFTFVLSVASRIIVDFAKSKQVQWNAHNQHSNPEGPSMSMIGLGNSQPVYKNQVHSL